MDILSNLNSKQKQAVTSIKGPILVIAGPGSGKTRCLTHRIAHLIKKGISANNILAVTFTNKAAEEMKQRVKNLVSVNVPAIGTFHSICLRILRAEIEKIENKKYKRNFVIYDDGDQVSLIKRTIKSLNISAEQFKPTLTREFISRAKDELIDYRLYQEKAQEFFPQTIAKIYAHYQQELEKANALDFDDLIMLAIKLFRENPQILEKYQEKWKYILVDEAHDTNTSQYALINLLAKKNRNVWLIADIDQSIYSWRGADYRNILNFEKDYPEAKTIILEENYRSTQNILQASHHIISKNIQRKEKKLWTKNPQGALINLVQLNNEQQEADFLIEEIENLIREKGFNLKDFTVLYRTNAQSRPIEEAFLKANFPYKIIGTVRFYERKEIKDILAYLKVTVNSSDLISMQRIINTPPRRLAQFAKDPDKIGEGNEKLKDFYHLIKNFEEQSQKMPLVDLINLVIKDSSYQQYVLDGTEEGEKRWENIQELFSVADKYNSISAPLGLEKFLEEISLLTDQDSIETNKDLVNLMTIHCAKGLEFPVVFIVGCEEGIFPHSRSSLDKEQLEEERRLCYVALTRAKQRAYLTFTRQRRFYGQILANSPSRFLMDIPEDLIIFRNEADF